MVSITAQNVSLVFPFIGSDSKFGRRLERTNEMEDRIGGEILTDPGKQKGVRAIDDLTLQLKPGDRLGIFGHNGAGKTTLLRVLAGIYPPTSGSIRIEGSVTGLFSLSLGINKELSGLENIKIKAMMFGMRKRDIMPLIPDIVAFSELGEYIHMPVKTYSSGMALRLQFSIATALNPDILLMDEWISSADKQFKDKMDKKLDEMVEKTPIVIIASHSETRLYSWANQVINLKNGRILKTEDTSDYKAPSTFKPDPELLKRYTLLTNLKKRDEAIQLVPLIWPEDEVPSTYYEKHAAYYLQTQQFENGIKAYEKAIEISPNNMKLKDQFGRLNLKVGNFDEAVEYLKLAIEGSQGTIGHVPSFEQACKEAGESEVYEDVMQRIYGGPL